MKNFLLILLLVSFSAIAQNTANPLKWYTSVEKTGDDTYNLIIEADIEDGWRLYSQFTDPEGSLPIKLEWHNAEGNYQLKGNAKEFDTHKAYNRIFKVTEAFFIKHAKFVQPIKVLKEDLKKIDVTLRGQANSHAAVQVYENLSFDLTKNNTSSKYNSSFK